MLRNLILATFCMAEFVLMAEPVEVKSVTAQQRYPWNGLVDIEVTLQGSVEEIAEAEWSFAAKNSATQVAIPVDHITQNGADVGSGSTWTRKFIWDAKADVGAVKIDEVVLSIGVTTVATDVGGVQLWENGPYWAKCNVGATKPEGYGYYFWWGDTVGYKRVGNSWNAVTGLCTGFQFDGIHCPTYGKTNDQLRDEGYIDLADNLIASHDAASVHLGKPWRLPTKVELQEMLVYCTSRWTIYNGVFGRVINGVGDYASKNIFLPAAGCGISDRLDNAGETGYYWFSAPNNGYTRMLWLSSGLFLDTDLNRHFGGSVRPVRNDVADAISQSVVTTRFSYDGMSGGDEELIDAPGLGFVTEEMIARQKDTEDAWILDDSAEIPGDFWTITSPDGNWTLACIPTTYSGCYPEYSGNADLLIDNAYWSDYDEIETTSGDVLVSCKTPGTLKLPAKVINSAGELLTVAIGGWIFEGWNSLIAQKITKIIIPADFTEDIGCGVSFNGPFEVENGNPRYSSQDGALYEGTTLLQCPSGKTGTFVISDFVKCVRAGAFEASQLNELVIGSQLEVFEPDHEVRFNLKKITINNNPHFEFKAEGFLVAKNGSDKEVVLSLGGLMIGTVNVPSDITAIRDCSLGYETTKDVDKLVFASKVLSVEEYGFKVASAKILDFSKVGTLTIVPDSFSDIESEAIYLPRNLEFMDNSSKVVAFDYAINLKHIYWATALTYDQVVSSYGRDFFYLNSGIRRNPVATLHVSATSDWPTTITFSNGRKVTVETGWTPEGVVQISAITYTNLKGATHSNPATYQEGTPVSFTAPLAVTGYTFTGWTPSAITATMTGTQTITANWSANTYAIRYDANGGSGTMANTAATYDQDVALPACGFTREGYEFIGWALEKTAQPESVPYRSGDVVRNLTTRQGGVVTLYAVWKVPLKVTAVTAQQRYPWNGLVDITVTLDGTADDIANAGCPFAAKNSATQAAIPVDHIAQNGADVGSGSTWTRKFIWDAKADVGAVKIDEIELSFGTKVNGGVQLWENGPYWAECNVGAEKPEEYGYYFCWGDTVGYDHDGSKWNAVDESSTGFVFGNGNCSTWGLSSSQLQSKGYIDSAGNITAEHDAATANLGTPWRIPTDAEFTALLSNCTTAWTTRNGVYGRLVTGKGAYSLKSIFFPAAGYAYGNNRVGDSSLGCYESSTPHGWGNLWHIEFDSGNFVRCSNARDAGRSVRPVRIGVAVNGNGVSTRLSLDCREGLKDLLPEGSKLRYDASWYEGADSIRILCNGSVLTSGVVGEFAWNPDPNRSVYQLELQAIKNGAVIASESAAMGPGYIRNVTARQLWPHNKVEVSYVVAEDIGEVVEEDEDLVVSCDAMRGSARTLIGDTSAKPGVHRVVWDLEADGVSFNKSDVRFSVGYGGETEVPPVVAKGGWSTRVATPSTWTPSSGNVLRGITPTFSGSRYNESGRVSSSDSLSRLTDGVVNLKGSSYENTIGIASGTLTWNLTSSIDLKFLRINTHWGDGGRDGIALNSIQIQKTGTTTWVDLEGSALTYGINNDSSGADLEFVFAVTANSVLATDVTAIRFNLGTQDNKGSGFTEFEAIGKDTMPSSAIAGATSGVSEPIEVSTLISSGTPLDASVSAKLGFSPIDTGLTTVVIDGEVLLSATNSGAFVWQPKTTGAHTVEHLAGTNHWTRTVNVTALAFAEPSTPNPPTAADSNIRLGATARSMVAAGGTVSITTSGSGTWNATTSADWLTFNGASSKAAGQSCIVRVAANAGVESRVGYVYVSGHVYTITQAGVGAELEAYAAAFGPEGGEGEIRVMAAEGSAWTVKPEDDWISVGEASGEGEGTISFVVAPFASVSSRTGSITIAGQTFEVQQGGRCLSISRLADEFDYRARDVEIVVTAFGSTQWRVTSSAAWVAVVAPTAELSCGSGKVRLTLGENSSYLKRSAFVTIGTERYEVEQAGRPTEALTFSISPEQKTAPAQGLDSDRVAIVATPDLPWTVESAADWLVVSSSAQEGAGNGQLVYAVAPNPWMSPRTGTIVITPDPASGKAACTLTVTQAAATASTSSDAQNFTGEGGAYEVEVTVGSVVNWTIAGTPGAGALPDWVRVDGPLNRLGPGKVKIIVAENHEIESRSTVITIAGQEFTITQNGRTIEVEYAHRAFACDGGDATVTVRPNGEVVNWTAVSSALWITIWAEDGAIDNPDFTVSGSSVGTVGYYVDPYEGTGAPRTGTITIGDKTVTITQYASATVPDGTEFVDATIGKEVTGRDEPVTVSASWVTETLVARYGVGKADAFKAAYGADLAAALAKPTGKVDANGRAMTVWDDYVAGTDPTDPTSVFKASVKMADGVPKVTWSPDLGAERVYRVLGAKGLGDAAGETHCGTVWEVVTEETKGDCKFFKVEVEMP